MRLAIMEGLQWSTMSDDYPSSASMPGMQRSSKVANERSKMHEKADLREANLNGAILADAKLGGAPRRGILLRHLHRAASDIVTTSDVTP